MWFWCFATEYLSPATPFCSHSGRRVSAWLPVSQLIQVTFCVKPSLLKLRHLSATVCLWNFSQSCKVNLCYLCCYHYFLLEHRHLWYKSGLFLRSCWFLLLVPVAGSCCWFLLMVSVDGFCCCSCHLLLSRATVGEVMSMSRDQLHSLFPELPDSVTEVGFPVLWLSSFFFPMIKYLGPGNYILSCPHKSLVFF